MPSWTIESEHKLLLTIIKLLNISQLPKWEDVSKEMQAQGLEFTPEGCRQHFQKIRKTSKSPSTPRKGSAGISKGSTPAKRKLSQMHRDDDVDDEEILKTPSKSSKSDYQARDFSNPPRGSAAPSKSAKAVKFENQQTAHIFKAEKPDKKGVIHIDDDESLYDGE
ncbi:hypothetical protein TWF694_003984 [Orbilia ellipsospora]|uniref:Myb-like domain-containing protein n=1 Tax=Orbilia ellipsospora TaxID=2528407 RepID=A0AAV9WY07_9PEZI